jgi:hypothetical protein
MPWLEIWIGISEVIAILLIYKVWKSGDYLFFKICFSVIALVPFLGPIFVLWATNFPPPQHSAFQDRARYRPDVFDRWRHIFAEKNPHARFRMWKAMFERKDNDKL